MRRTLTPPLLVDPYEWEYEKFPDHHKAFREIYPLNFPDTNRRNPGVYGICNSRKEYFYIGASTHVRQRIVKHWYQLQKGHHNNKKLQKAYDTHFLLYAIYLHKDPYKEEFFNKKYIAGRNGEEKFYHEMY